MAKGAIFGLEDAIHATSILPVRIAFSFALNQHIKSVERLINKSIKRRFTTTRDPSKVSSIQKSTKDNLTASVSYVYESHNMMEFAHKLVLVQNPNGSFTYSARVRIKSSENFREVRNKYGYKAFSFPGKKFMWARHQQPTWVGKKRAPYSPLYGPSIAAMSRSPEVEEDIRKSNFSGRIVKSTLGKL